LPVKLITEQHDAVTLLRIKEARVDAHSAGELKNAIAGLLDGGKAKVLVDLSEVDFMDSSGLSALISGYKAATAAGQSLRLAALRPQVRSIFELTRLHRVFEIYPSVEQGLAGFGAPT
jgi:anti-sigma B factor antagonist